MTEPTLQIALCAFILLVLLVVAEQRGWVDLDRRWREFRHRSNEPDSVEMPIALPRGPLLDGRWGISLFGTLFRLLRWLVLEIVALAVHCWPRHRPQREDNVIPLYRRANSRWGAQEWRR